MTSASAPTVPDDSIFVDEDIHELVEEAMGFLDEDGDERTTPEIIQNYGYKCEVQQVTTSDGYKLQLHRIPHGKHGASGPRPVVLLVHGLLQSSASFAIDERSASYMSYL